MLLHKGCLAGFEHGSQDSLDSRRVQGKVNIPPEEPTQAGMSERTSLSDICFEECKSVDAAEIDTHVPSGNDKEQGVLVQEAEGADVNLTCAICMDRHRDITLSPCGHTHCCSSCFERLRTPTCPICRRPSEKVTLLGDGAILSVLHPSGGNVNSGMSPRPPRLNQATSRGLRRRRTSSVSQDVRSSSRTIPSPAPIVQQAESSTRSLSSMRRSSMRYVRRERPTQEHIGCVTDESSASIRPIQTVTTPALNTIAKENTDLKVKARNVVLLGQSTFLMRTLCDRLRNVFPAPPWLERSTYEKQQSLLYVGNEPMRLVLLESPPELSNPEAFAAFVHQYAPKMIILCASFFDVLSFEFLVRLDLDIHDLINVPCLWVLIKRDRLHDRGVANKVEHTDVSAAKHFVSSPRRCVTVPIDAVFPLHIRRLGFAMRQSVSDPRGAYQPRVLPKHWPSRPWFPRWGRTASKYTDKGIQVSQCLPIRVRS